MSEPIQPAAPETEKSPPAEGREKEKSPIAPEGTAATESAGDAKERGGSTKGSAIRIAEDKQALARLVSKLREKSSAGTILVPVDFSPHSEAALALAAELAEKLSARLMILHVVHDPGEMPGYYAKLVKKKRVARIQDIAREVFEDFLRDFIATHPDLKPVRKAEKLMIIGLPVTRILQVIDKAKPTMVVMGSQGRTGLKHLLLGSKAEQVVQLSPVPVTIVKRAVDAEKN